MFLAQAIFKKHHFNSIHSQMFIEFQYFQYQSTSSVSKLNKILSIQTLYFLRLLHNQYLLRYKTKRTVISNTFSNKFWIGLLWKQFFMIFN